MIESLEMEMELLCLTGVEDQLQADVRPTLETLRNAGIKVGLPVRQGLASDLAAVLKQPPGRHWPWKLGVVSHACNLGTWGSVIRSQAQGQPGTW